MNRILLVCGVTALLVGGCSARSSGAPTSVCNDPLMEPTYHIDNFAATGVNNTNEYTLTSEPVVGSPGLFKVTLSGPVFKGYTVRATTTNAKNLGEFIADANASEFQVMHCASEKDVAVTHASATDKSSVTLFWLDRNNGNYVLQATVVPDINTYVTLIYEQ
ncbi:uncharacterized protein LOC127009313 [Eriocheir sinensis]|uniref:uncharacterized protein LOC127009313 n=1 Tax=Eriocheir sinensis TaxID=95602 RepID=UPI0021C65A6D|nr:uncharacterized protein LOC127009313 [Eriocheir sinensis]